METDGFVVLLALAVLVFFVGGNWLIGQLGKSRKKFLKAPFSTVKDVKEGKTLLFVGKIRAHLEFPASETPIGGKKALIWTNALRRIDHESDSAYSTVDSEKHFVGVLLFEDETGVVEVRTEKCRAMMERSGTYETVPMDKVDAFLERQNLKYDQIDEGFPWGLKILPGDYRFVEHFLAEGDQVVLVGKCRKEAGAGFGSSHEGGYREAPSHMVIEAGEEPLYVSSLESEIKKAKPRRG